MTSLGPKFQWPTTSTSHVPLFLTIYLNFMVSLSCLILASRFLLLWRTRVSASGQHRSLAQLPRLLGVLDSQLSPAHQKLPSTKRSWLTQDYNFFPGALHIQWLVDVGVQRPSFFWLNQRHLCRAIPTLFSQWDQLRIQLCWTTLHFNFSLCLILLPLLPYRFIHQIKCLYKNLHFRVCLAGKET